MKTRTEAWKDAEKRNLQSASSDPSSQSGSESQTHDWWIHWFEPRQRNSPLRWHMSWGAIWPGGQPTSSDRSVQSKLPSQRHRNGMHCELLHCHSLSGQVTGSVKFIPVAKYTNLLHLIRGLSFCSNSLSTQNCWCKFYTKQPPIRCSMQYAVKHTVSNPFTDFLQIQLWQWW